MPITKVISTDLIPTFVAKPDQRFATTALSYKYRDYAVPGEIITDKTSGELFIKRIEDEKVLSFQQNHKYLHDLMLELRVVLNNNAWFRYPGDKNRDAYYVFADYDLVTINDEKDLNVLWNNSIVPNDNKTRLHQLYFNMSKETNGFVIRLTSRDCDKAVINFINNQYNKYMKGYEGYNRTFIAEAQRFKDIEKWEDSDCTITYNVTATKNGESRTISCADYIRLNEDCCVNIPEVPLSLTFPNGYDILQIEITGVSYEKIHTMINNQKEITEEFGNEFNEGYNKLLYPDKNVFVRYISIGYFLGCIRDLDLIGNENIIALIDMPYAYRYLMKMSKLKESSDFILSTTRPNDEDWCTNGIWAERLRDVFENGLTIVRNHEVDIEALEMFLGKDTAYNNMKITENKFLEDYMYLLTNSEMYYTEAQIDRKVSQLREYLDDKIQPHNIVSTNRETVENSGLLFEVEKEIKPENPEKEGE